MLVALLLLSLITLAATSVIFMPTKENNPLKDVLTENSALKKYRSSSFPDEFFANVREGDILYTSHNEIDENGGSSAAVIRAKRQAFTDYRYPSYFWKDGQIRYSFHSGLSYHAKSILKKAMTLWESNTCVNFTHASHDESDLVFMKGIGCYSYVGHIWYWKKQPLSIGNRCEHIHTMSHEIGHALGFLHTHNRADRDEYVSVNLANVKKELKMNFKRASSYMNSNYGLPYDYGSVMHYSKRAFTANSGITIVPHDYRYEDTMGSGTGPTFIDYLMMNTHYNCLNKCERKIPCKNGGYPHPRQCQKCMCPSGYGGQYCEHRAVSTSSCGGNLRASYRWRTFSEWMGDGRFKDEMSYCNWWIEAGEDQIIEVEIIRLNGVCSEGCIFGGTEFKANSDKRLTGYRFCCGESSRQKFEAKGPVLPVIMFNRKDYTYVQFRYRIKNSRT